METNNEEIYREIDKKVETIKKKVLTYMKSVTEDIVKQEIEKAYVFAKKAHEGCFRLSWDPYIIHPIEATLLLLHIKPDIHTIQACILHDVIEDTEYTYEDILSNFWIEVATLCSGMEKLSKVRYKGTEEDRAIQNLRKMFLAMNDDLRVVFIKMADRLHNMKTLKYHPKKEKQNRIALETLTIYSPIADRLGLYWFKNQLEEEAFKILNPYEYNKIKKELDQYREHQKIFELHAKEFIVNLLKDKIEDFRIEFRVKTIYSIYKKLQRKNLASVDDLHDIFWVKILVPTVTDCYKVLGYIHSVTTPIPKHFKDYIALPKPNGYQSLHTTVLWFLRKHHSQPTEIQIKTYEMEEISQIGIAAHFEYKEKGSVIAKDIHWVKQLKELTQNLWNEELMDSLKIDLFKDRIFVLTPKWDTINLPAWSTPIDFAYEIHTDLWNHIYLAKVNNQIYPLDKELHNGDVVEIIIDKNKKPNPLYLSVVKTAKAKSAIRSFLRNEDRKHNIEQGREILNNFLHKAWMKKLDKDLSILRCIDDKVLSMEERLEILEKIGTLAIHPSSIIKKICTLWQKQKLQKHLDNTTRNDIDEKEHTKEKQVIVQKISKNKTLIIWWQKGIYYEIATCCKEKVDHNIVWYINKKGIVMIHNRDCPILKKWNPERLLSAYYEEDEKVKIMYSIDFVIQNEFVYFKKIVDIFYEMNFHVWRVHTREWENQDLMHVVFEIIIFDYDYMIIDRMVNRVKLTLWEKYKEHSIKFLKNITF